MGNLIQHTCDRRPFCEVLPSFIDGQWHIMDPIDGQTYGRAINFCPWCGSDLVHPRSYKVHDPECTVCKGPCQGH